MATAHDVAKFFLSRIDDTNGDTVTHLKLQKLVYYAQAWSLTLRNQELFAGSIEAWINGPVSREVWTAYKPYSGNPIPKLEDFDGTVFSNEESSLLNLISSTYGDFTAGKLWRLSHTEHPWLEARRGFPEDKNSDTVIEHEWMKSYYSSFIDIYSKAIHSEVFSENKDLDSLITIKQDGLDVQMRTEELFQYLERLPKEFVEVKPRRRQRC